MSAAPQQPQELCIPRTRAQRHQQKCVTAYLGKREHEERSAVASMKKGVKAGGTLTWNGWELSA